VETTAGQGASVRRILIGLLIVVFVAGIVTALVGRVTPSARVYPVAEVQAGLRQRRPAWVSRTVLVRGWAWQWMGSSSNCGYARPRTAPGACQTTWIGLWPFGPPTSPLRPQQATARLLVRLPPGTALGVLPNRVGPVDLLAIVRSVARTIPWIDSALFGASDPQTFRCVSSPIATLPLGHVTACLSRSKKACPGAPS